MSKSSGTAKPILLFILYTESNNSGDEVQVCKIKNTTVNLLFFQNIGSKVHAPHNILSLTSSRRFHFHSVALAKNIYSGEGVNGYDPRARVCFTSIKGGNGGQRIACCFLFSSF